MRSSACTVAPCIVLLLCAYPGWSQPKKVGSDNAAAGLGQEAVEVRTIRATIAWNMLPRFDTGWSSYDPETRRYLDAYVRPTTFDVVFDACGSDGGEALISEIRIEILSSPKGSVPQETTLTDGACRFETVLGSGPHVVAATVVNENDEAATATADVVVRDWLIVSLGDSLSSGEGVPDRTADVASFLLPTEGLTGIPIDCREIDDGNLDAGEIATAINKFFGNETEWTLPLNRPSEWVDRTCHRSRRSGPALAAKALEDVDPHSSVTFVSLACSGASLAQGVLGRYDGQEIVVGFSELEAQVDTLREMVGDRHIDALMLSAGINDIGFADILVTGVKEKGSTSREEISRRFQQGAGQLRSRFEELNDVLETTVRRRAAAELQRFRVPPVRISRAAASGTPSARGARPPSERPHSKVLT